MNKYFWYLLIFLYLIYYLWLSTNPSKFDFTKSTYFKYIPSKYLLNYSVIKKKEDLYNIVNYPVIFKPEICNTTGRGVSLIQNLFEAKKYWENVNDTIIAQDYANMKYEVTILYEKMPYHKKGNIVNISLRNNTKLKFEPLSCQNNSCHQQSDWITPRLNHTIDQIANRIPNLYAARFDIRFDNLNQFLQGNSFKILEVNGVMGYDNSAFNLNSDKYKGFYSKIENSIKSIRWFITRLYIGLVNIILLNSCNPLYPIFYFIYKLYYVFKCRDWGHVFYGSMTC
jgi:hypothetical protein